ncbi:hypothetical protein [Nostoc sp. T09]|uniref:hypothetical protein n=1 Tax=Nostoc sp. T09 TaxID=1932621 RepID=UPI001180DC02|nr:hypothetical protein [Nostoc sp. T09]
MPQRNNKWQRTNGPSGSPVATREGTPTDSLTPLALSRETRPTQWLLKSGNPFGNCSWGTRGPLWGLGANPQDRIASPRNCPPQRTGSPMTNDSCKQIY